MSATLFWDREPAMARLRKSLGRPAFGYVTGRRRVGKTALLSEAVRRFGGLYHQAVEGTAQQQLLHLAQEWQESRPIFREVVPRSWSEFFSLLSRQELPALLVFDEFPYWVQGDPSLPSLLQKWVDHHLPKTKTTLLVSGSSQSMLHSVFLDSSAPLYGRATLHWNLNPLSFGWFCRALRYDESDPLAFERYSLVGGVPHYWKLLSRDDIARQAEALYFEPSAILAEEPKNWLRDERVGGSLPKAILDLIGRGVAKPSELAGRVGTVHGNLTRPLALLLDLGFIQRELPFGESHRTSKKVLYSIADPSLSFYYGTCLAHRERWRALSKKGKMDLIHQHASRCWESYCRRVWGGASRYWEGEAELDLVAWDEKAQKLLVAECKWQDLNSTQEKGILEKLRASFFRTQLANRYPKVEFRIFCQKDLKAISSREI